VSCGCRHSPYNDTGFFPKGESLRTNQHSLFRTNPGKCVRKVFPLMGKFANKPAQPVPNKPWEVCPQGFPSHIDETKTTEKITQLTNMDAEGSQGTGNNVKPNTPARPVPRLTALLHICVLITAPVWTECPRMYLKTMGENKPLQCKL